jgi:hypothetical protein
MRIMSSTWRYREHRNTTVEVLTLVVEDMGYWYSYMVRSETSTILFSQHGNIPQDFNLHTVSNNRLQYEAIRHYNPCHCWCTRAFGHPHCINEVHGLLSSNCRFLTKQFDIVNFYNKPAKYWHFF